MLSSDLYLLDEVDSFIEYWNGLEIEFFLERSTSDHIISKKEMIYGSSNNALMARMS